MGTTLDSFKDNDGLQIAMVICIEGYEYLISDYAGEGINPSVADMFDSGTGWSGTGWTSALGGLSLEGAVFTQKIIPWDNGIKGSDLSFRVMDYDGSDQFGKDVFNQSGTTTTILAQSIDNNDTTITVKDASRFDGGSTAYIGCERISYSSITTGSGTETLNSVTRGKFSPFQTDGGTPFARTHTLTEFNNQVPSAIKVTSTPVHWLGKWVALYCHEVKGGVMCTRANAELIFSGKIANVQDNSDGSTQVFCEDLLSVVKSGTLMWDQWHGRVPDGYYWKTTSHMILTLYIRQAAGDVLKEIDLTSASFEFVAGTHYSIWEIVDGINEGLNDLKVDASPPSVPVGVSAQLGTSIENINFGGLRFSITLPEPAEYDGAAILAMTGSQLTLSKDLAYFLGFDVDPNETGDVTFPRKQNGDFLMFIHGEKVPLIAKAFQGADGGTLIIHQSEGTWINNTGVLPQLVTSAASIPSGENWGCIQAGDHIIAGKYHSDTEIRNATVIERFRKHFGPHPFLTLRDSGFGEVRFGESRDILNIKQVFLSEMSFRDTLCTFLGTTGVTSYNEATFDLGGTLGEQMGLGIPYKLIDSAFENSVAGLDGGEAQIHILLDGPTTLETIFLSEFTLRAAYMVFKDGTLRMVAPQTPISGMSVHSLLESNKASPTGSEDALMTPTQITSDHIRNVFELQFDRYITDRSKYANKRIFKFQSSIQDHGEARKITVRADNTFTCFSLNEIDFLSTQIVSKILPAWGRPLRLLRRTVDLSLYRNIAPGDQCVVTDLFARDPQTGERGLTTKPGIILSHSMALSGDLYGEVDILIGILDDAAVYCPSCKVDESATNAGLNAGTNTLTVKLNHFTKALDDIAYDSGHFTADEVVRIEEISPSDPASTTYWERTIASVTTTTIVLTAAISSPAWDSSKEYWIYSVAYGSAYASQQLDTFQADDADYRLLNTKDPYSYSDTNDQFISTASATTLPAKHSNSWFGDGAPLSTAHHKNLGTMVNNLIGYRTGQKGAFMTGTRTFFTGATAATYKLMSIFPFYVGVGEHTPGAARIVRVSPYFKSATSGQTVYVRITISRDPPQVLNTSNASNNNVVFLPPFTQAAFSSSSTTYGGQTVQKLPFHFDTNSGLCFVSIETKGSGSAACNFTGMERCEVGAPGDTS